MNELQFWFQAYGNLPLVYQIAIPVAFLLLIALYAFFLWAAARIISRDEFTFARSFLISGIDFLAMLGVSYGLSKVFTGELLLTLGPTQTLIYYNLAYHAISFLLLVGLLLSMGGMYFGESALAWVVRFVLLFHLGCFVVGATYIGSAMYVGVQFSGDAGGVLYTKTLTTGILLVVAALAGLVLWMAGALASAEKLSYLRALLVAVVKGAILAGVYLLGKEPLETMLPDLTGVQRLLIMGGVIVVLDLFLVVLGSMLLGGTSLGRGILVWVFELPLWALLGLLVVGIEMVSLSIYQTAQTSEGAKVLEYVTVGLLGAVGAALLIFFGGQLLTPAVGAPRRSTT
jgi:hypothetical protein